MSYRGDASCRYCGRPIRWVDDDGRRLALNVAPVAAGGSYRVVGAGTATRIPKAERSKYDKLYVPHNSKSACSGWENAQAMKARAARDRAEARRPREARPANVAMFADFKKGNR